ncbi:MAG: EamA family transporter RarD [Prevotellaceae bacterium]|jgi:chloramphenicol-sensitive protein RarD|nr:EamA family transporter RarD [Prevotellaceae bacterium]
MYAFACYITWGLFPVFWKMFTELSALTVLAHRIVWAFVFLFCWIMIVGNKSFFAYLQQPRTLATLALASFVVCFNWGTYIYAVESNRIIEAGLGYYINPLVNVLFGYLFLKERLTPMQKAAVASAAAGVAYLAVSYGEIPWISLVLSFSFGFYGLVKKKLKLEAMPSLAAETLTMVPLAAIFLTYNIIGKDEALFASPKLAMLLVAGGIVTAIPLFWFGKASQSVSLSTLGFIQYLTPTLQVLVGVLIYGELFDLDYLVCFAFVWLGLALYTIGIIRRKSLSTSLIQ